MDLAHLENAPATEILRWAVGSFDPAKIALSSAFGPGSAVLIHMLADIAPRMPVIFIDTLHHFDETLAHVARVTARYGLDLRVVKGAANRKAFEDEHGGRLWERDLDRYLHLTKVAVFRAATSSLDGWITGRRRDQSTSRHDLPVVEIKDKIRINPLARWTGEEIWEFIHEHGLPYNSLHDRGYKSVGDEPLTTPVDTGEAERSGRWRGTSVLECGIHG